ncbi:MAG: hypothetical protein JW781_01715 [Deltaproteobacteria bacterium]|nr:hypothetical protein [Candidatus Anaeroferrophillacea bacterium]
MTRGERLVQDGWHRQFSAAGERLQMAIEAFAEMGQEVVLVAPADDVPGAGDGPCTGCGAVDIPGLQTIFTRKVT